MPKIITSANRQPEAVSLGTATLTPSVSNTGNMSTSKRGYELDSISPARAYKCSRISEQYEQSILPRSSSFVSINSIESHDQAPPPPKIINQFNKKDKFMFSISLIDEWNLSSSRRLASGGIAIYDNHQSDMSPAKVQQLVRESLLIFFRISEDQLAECPLLQVMQQDYNPKRETALRVLVEKGIHQRTHFEHTPLFGNTNQHAHITVRVMSRLLHINLCAFYILNETHETPKHFMYLPASISIINEKESELERLDLYSQDEIRALGLTEVPMSSYWSDTTQMVRRNHLSSVSQIFAEAPEDMKNGRLEFAENEGQATKFDEFGRVILWKTVAQAVLVDSETEDGEIFESDSDSSVHGASTQERSVSDG